MAPLPFGPYTTGREAYEAADADRRCDYAAEIARAALARLEKAD